MVIFWVRKEMIALTRLLTIMNVEATGNQAKNMNHKAPWANLRINKFSKWSINWIRNDVQMKVREKKRLYHKFLVEQLNESNQGT